jgi:uncharacterized protein
MSIFKRFGAAVRRAYLAFLARPSTTSNALTEPVAQEGTLSWTRIHQLLSGGSISLEDFNPTRGGRLDYRMPEELPGVRPVALPKEEVTHGDGGVVLALDAAGYKEKLATDNDFSGPSSWGFGSGGGAIGPGLAFLGFPYLSELSQISEYRTPAESLAAEMTRRWGKLKNTGKDALDDKMKEITQRMEVLDVRGLFRQGAYKTETFGRSHLYVSVRGQDSDRERQLPLTKIEKGSLVGFSIIEPYWCTPYSWNATHPERPDFYKPSSWFVLGRKTHNTRLLTFIFREVPDLLKPAYSFAGISITQLMMPYVNRWLRTAKSVNDLINIFSIVTLATDLAATLNLAQDNPKSLFQRMKAFVAGRDNKGVMLINKGTEELTLNDVSLGSLDKLQAQAQEHMATPSRMTLLKFFGITPTGLNASAEPEREAWNDYVHAMQELGFSKILKVVIDLIQMDLYGTVDPNLVWEWESLLEPTGKEKAEILKSETDRDLGYLDHNVIDANEVRNKLRKNPESGYDGLTGNAPEPQDWPQNQPNPNETEVETEEK